MSHRFSITVLGSLFLGLGFGLGACSSSDDTEEPTSSGSSAGTGEQAASSGSSGGTEDAGVGGSGPGGGAGGETAAPIWSVVTPPAGAEIHKVAGDARGVWAAFAKRDSSPVVSVASLSSTGELTERFSTTATASTLSNYLPAAIAPVGSESAVVGGDWILQVVGSTPRD